MGLVERKHVIPLCKKAKLNPACYDTEANMLYIDLYVLGDDALIRGLSCKPNIYDS